METKNIRKSYKLAERKDDLKRSETLITLKDHKVNFYNKGSCHLSNPTKNKLQQITKKIIKSNEQKKINQER